MMRTVSSAIQRYNDDTYVLYKKKERKLQGRKTLLQSPDVERNLQSCMP